LTEGWRTSGPRYAIVQKLYLGAAATLGISGLYVWSRGYKIRFGEGCDAGFENPWAFAFKLFLVVVSWVLLANVRLILQRINASASTAKAT